MSEIYNEQYYHSGCGPIPYEESGTWMSFFGNVADRIVNDFHPKIVLDAGCAMGYLVAALRDRGVEAYGVDISEYAISKVREDIKPYCIVGSLSDEFPSVLPQRYDLVITIEVLEHLYPEECVKAIKNLCLLSDTVIFSSTPDDFAERTHVNVQQREYWARMFAENGFYDDLLYRPTYLTSYAACYRKQSDLMRQIESYERNIRISEFEHKQCCEQYEKAIFDKETHIQNIENILAAKKAEYEALLENNKHTLAALEESNNQNVNLRAEVEKQKNELNKLNEEINHYSAEIEKQSDEIEKQLDEIEKQASEINKANEEINALNKELDHYKLHYHAAINQRNALQASYDEISNAAFWKITKPLRVMVDSIKKPLRKCRPLFLLWRGAKCLKCHGVKYTAKKIKSKLFSKHLKGKLASKPLYTKEELLAQKNYKFRKNILFSIVVPLYNTPPQFLREMIESVRAQTYSNWELCLADGSDDKHDEVGKICASYMKKDKRIKYKKLKKNLGISGNTNKCLAMTQGDYVGLFDHDDLLHPAALYDVMKVICEQNADFIYTDENTFRNTPADAYCPHFKPDYAPDTLRTNNYICHFTVFKRSLLKVVGGFRPECDGSQDYDMVLRLTEKAEKIVHIPKILYYWRAHANSVADGVGAKPYVIAAAHKALEDHLKRVGLDGEVLDTVVPSMYRIKYEIKNNPLVSILIPSYEHKEELEKCILSIYEKSTYRNFEIIIIENNSKSKKIFDYYETLKKSYDNLKVVMWDSYFNYSAINNFGAKFAKGEYLLLLNNDIEVISENWIEEMLMFAQRNDIGAVGSKLFYPDNTIQHAGIGVGLLTLAGHYHRGFDRNHPGYMGRLIYAHNVSAVTAACVMIRRDVWDEISGLDESFEVAFNDVDLCMRIRKVGYLIVWTPFAELYHYESKSRGFEDTPQKQKRFESEVLRFQKRWAKELDDGDPYYNPNFTLEREDFSVR